MRKSTSKIFAGLLLSAVTVLLITSCQKEQNEFVSNSSDSQADISLTESSAKYASPGCACNIPDSLQPPAGNKLTLQVYAKGVQIYEVRRSATNPNSFSWVNIAPSANLYEKANF